MHKVAKPIKNKIWLMFLAMFFSIGIFVVCLVSNIVAYNNVITGYADGYYNIAVVSGSMEEYESSIEDYIEFGGEYYHNEADNAYKAFRYDFMNLYYARFEYSQTVRYEIENISGYVGKIDSAMELIKDYNNMGYNRDVYDSDISQYISESKSLITNVLRAQSADSNEVYEDVTVSTLVYIICMVVALVLFIFIAVMLVIFINLRVSKPVKEINDWACLFRDDYCQMSPLSYETEDEIQMLAESFNIVRDKMIESQRMNEEMKSTVARLHTEEEHKKKFVQMLYEEKREKESISIAAQHDGLTGLYNRRTFDGFVNEFVTKRPGNKDGALFLIDMDNFKTVNDSLGHLKGDEALKLLAGAMRIVFNGGYLGRYGGDEFVAFMIGCTGDSDMERYGSELCHKMHQVMESNGVSVQLSVSIGAASTEGLRDSSQLYLRADKALYHSKENGRNQYTIYSDRL